MDATRFPFRSVLRWSLAGCCAVLLWVAGYFGGRNTGFDAGHAEGMTLGRVEGFRQSMERHGKEIYTAAYPVDELLKKRFAERRSAVPKAMQSIDAEMGELIKEIFADVAPNHVPSVDPPSFEISSLPAKQLLVVNCDGVRHAEVAVYLYSREDYFLWKRSQQKP